MTIDIFSAEEQALLEAWFRSAPIDQRLGGLLDAAGFDHDCQHYTRLDAWVGAFAVAEIQEQLPNCGICDGRGVTLTRSYREVEDRTVTGLSRHLFTINWADSGPGISWPVAYTLVWIPVFDEFVVVASADGTDAFGYADFALGHFPAGGDWVAQVKEIVVDDWRAQHAGWDQAAWAYLFDSGAIPEEETMAWRREVWAGTDWWDEPDPEEEETEEEEEEPAELVTETPPQASRPRTQVAIPLGPVTHVRIRLKRWREFPPTPDNDYAAEIIRDGDGFLYRARGVTLPITEGEACLIVSEPFLYYFSTALRIHTTIDRIKEGQPEHEAASTGESNDKESEEVVS